MAQPRHPAAYLRAAPGEDPGALARQHQAVAEAARQRAWPEPVVYSDDDPGLADRYGPALARLEAAIVARRHDALLLAGPGMAGGRARTGRWNAQILIMARSINTMSL